MPSIYSKNTKELISEFLDSFVPPKDKGFGLFERKPLSEGGEFHRKEIINWFQENYPKIKEGTINAHLILLSTNAPSRVHYNLRQNGADDLLYQINRSSFRLYNKESDPSPIYKDSDNETSDEHDNSEEPDSESHEFAYEKDLKNFLANNLQIISPNLKLYEDGDIKGIEFPVGGRFIDILAIDNQDLVIIELKVSKGYDRALGQLLRYMGWIEQNLAEPSQKIKGMIIARQISDDLKLATSRINDVELFEYSLSVSLKKVEK